MTTGSGPGKLIVISGPSGSGKNTLIRELLRRSKWPLVLSVSATTRPPRPGEKHGVDYFFLSEEEFRKLAAEGGFLEYAEYVGHLYGTPRQWVEEQLRQGKWVILEIDVQGALQIKKRFPDAVLIFVRTSSLEEYERRLRQRGTENEEEIKRRLEQARRELEYVPYYDYVVVNDDLEQAVQQVEAIFDELGGGPKCTQS